MALRTSLAVVAIAAAVATASGAVHADTQVSGTIDNSSPTDGLRHEVFSCTGSPTCTGVHTVTLQPVGCSNPRISSGNVTFSGLDLSRPGTFSGSQILAHRTQVTRNPDGTCTYTRVSGLSWSFTGTWDGSNGTLDITAIPPSGNSRNERGTFTATITQGPPPVFPMSVVASISPTTATASAVVMPRPQDAGITASIFVFAQVPSSLIGKAAAKSRGPDAPVPAATLEGNICVLAQVGADGHLAAVSSSSLQPYVTGVLSTQGQSVAILNAAPTPSVAGATFFVGYGSSATAMFANGVYQAAVTVPGSPQCSAPLASAAAPASPGGLTGLWWNPGESGWGVHFTQRGNAVFVAWYTYDDAGNPKWYVASDCVMPSAGATNGTCSGALYEVHGGPFFGAAPFDPSAVKPQPVGTLQIAFTDANNASMSYTVNGKSRTVGIVRQVFQTGATSPAVDFTDLWWNTGESGWGMAISQQYGVMFLAWFVYDGGGNPVWYVATDCTVSGSGCSGTLYRTVGPPFGPTFDPSKVQAFPVGDIAVDFSDPNHATLSYTVSGVVSTKRITRQLF